ncbi:hypothetical protein PHISP_07080, partial [Aspergillus sp. HF37]
PDRLSVNELKKQIRNARRLLARDDLPADSRIVQERALAGFEKELDEETRRRQRSEMIGKYHFVRFLDRKSASKDLKKLLRREKETKETEGTDQALARRIHVARINLNYTIYYPLTEKYVSLYADKQQKKREKKNVDTQSQDSDNDSNVGIETRADDADPCSADASKPAMWHVIEKCTLQGQETLDLLREGKLEDASASGMDGSAAAPSHDRAKQKDKEDNKGGSKKVDVEMHDSKNSEESADDSDGGFFE